MKRVFFSLLCILPGVVLASGGQAIWTASEALSRLQAGNQRFVNEAPNRWNGGESRREHLAQGQSPYACVITCSDSRLGPEQIFDTGLGELFVIRLAGNVVTREAIASVDYAVGHLNCPVVLVMGHTKCGAVGAAMSSSDFSEPLNTLVQQIRPSVDACQMKGYGSDDLYNASIRENARAGAAALLSGSRAIDEAVFRGECVVLSAVYDLNSGEVQWLSQMQAPAREAIASTKKAADSHDTHAEAAHGDAHGDAHATDSHGKKDSDHASKSGHQTYKSKLKDKKAASESSHATRDSHSSSSSSSGKKHH